MWAWEDWGASPLGLAPTWTATFEKRDKMQYFIAAKLKIFAASYIFEWFSLFSVKNNLKMSFFGVFSC